MPPDATLGEHLGAGFSETLATGGPPYIIGVGSGWGYSYSYAISGTAIMVSSFLGQKCQTAGAAEAN